MISPAQAAEYLDAALGISAPAFVLRAAVETIEACEPAMVAAGYAEAKQTLVQSMAVAIVAAAGSPRRISSQGAPSGKSRSFKNDDQALSKLRRALAALDTAGTVTAAVGPDPSLSPTLLLVV